MTQTILHRQLRGDSALPVVEGAILSEEMGQVMALLRASANVDFRCYRKPMLMRRIRRRMILARQNCIAGYLDFLRKHPEEVQLLARDLLISVTSFFRDPEAWRILETDVIAPLVRGKEPGQPIRAWAVGCATGGEAYSLAMLLSEQLAANRQSCPVRIFATDVDENALEIARRGLYPESICQDIAVARLARFFTPVGDSSYQVSERLREMIVFARQNVISDAPFFRMDLVVCRNLLIYLERETQERVISLLHYALNDAGVLFLGASETIGRNEKLFEPISSRWRIFRRATWLGLKARGLFGVMDSANAPFLP